MLCPYLCQPGKHVEMDKCSKKCVIFITKEKFKCHSEQSKFHFHYTLSLASLVYRLGPAESVMVVYELSLAMVSKLTH